MDWPSIWFGETPRARLIRGALTPLAWGYELGWRSYRWIYFAGLKKPIQPHRPILCVGNLTVGGSGKTPVTLHLAELLLEMGYHVVIGASGYGSPRSRAASLAPAGELDAAEWGDEPALYRWQLPKVPIIVGRRRVLAAEIAAREFPGFVLLMDDGYQHLPLRKDWTLLLDDPGVNSRTVPAGPYREPRRFARYASLIIGEGQRFSIRSTLEGGWDPITDRIDPVSGSLDVLCALGRPDRFVASLQAQGAEIGETRQLPDHDPLTDAELFQGLGEQPLWVTAKDWVKLRRRHDLPPTLRVAQHRVTLEPGAEFRSWLKERLG